MKPIIFLLSIFLFLFFSFPGFCHKWVADTIVAEFGNSDANMKLDFNLIDVKDKRKTFPEFLSVFEKKKLLIFPVDQIVKTKNSLSDNLKQKFHSDSLNVYNYIAVIHDFNIKNSRAFDKRYLSLFSTIELFRLNNLNDTSLIGTFYYDGTFKQKTKDDIKKGYEFLLQDWSEKYSTDIIAVEKGLDFVMPDKYYYFRRNQSAVSKNLYASIDLFAGLRFWGVDAELWFSNPEGSRLFNRNSGVIRYVNHAEYQSIAVGGNIKHLYYRINNLMMFENKMAMLLGVNNWKDIKTVPHKFEEIFSFNVSMSQKIFYNKLDNKGIVFGLGIMEDLSYVIYHRLKFNVGLSLCCAYKF